jgi:hypothetical protein
MSKLSPELIARITKYFAQKYEVTLTPEQAEEYLSSLGALFLAVHDSKKQNNNSNTTST